MLLTVLALDDPRYVGKKAATYQPPWRILHVTWRSRIISNVFFPPRATRLPGFVANTAGTEMCLELVRTRAFAALLSDEVFADVDLETVQVSHPIALVRKSTGKREGLIFGAPSVSAVS